MTYFIHTNLQKTILHLAKSDKEFLVQILPLIKSSYFEFPSYSKIFDVIKDHYDQYLTLPTDEIILDKIKKTLKSNDGIEDYEDDIILINKVAASSLENSEYILDSVEEFARQQAIKEGIRECVRLIEDNRLDETEQIIRNALLVRRNLDLGQKYFNDIDSRWSRIIKANNEDKFKTVFPTCNFLLGGGNSKKELCVVAAPGGGGKSLYLVNQAVVSLMEGRKVLYISLEMSEDKIANRFDSITTLLPNSKLKEPTMQMSLKQRLKIFQDNFPGAKLIIKEFPTGIANVNSIRSLLSQLRIYEEFIPEVIIIDYLELLRPLRIIDIEYLAQQRIAEEVRGLAIENNCLVWTATQTNRESKKVCIITDAHLGDSYGKIRTVDWAISLNQTEEEYNNGKLRIYVMKARDAKQHYLVPGKINYINLRMEEAKNEEILEDE